MNIEEEKLAVEHIADAIKHTKHMFNEEELKRVERFIRQKTTHIEAYDNRATYRPYASNH